MSAFAAFTWRALFALLLLGFILADTWPVSAREQWAARTAHSYCAAHPQSPSCDPHKNPISAAFGRWLEQAG